jgi:hypothetical protein
MLAHQPSGLWHHQGEALALSQSRQRCLRHGTGFISICTCTLAHGAVLPMRVTVHQSASERPAGSQHSKARHTETHNGGRTVTVRLCGLLLRVLWTLVLVKVARFGQHMLA